MRVVLLLVLAFSLVGLAPTAAADDGGACVSAGPSGASVHLKSCIVQVVEAVPCFGRPC